MLWEYLTHSPESALFFFSFFIIQQMWVRWEFELSTSRKEINVLTTKFWSYRYNLSITRKITTAMNYCCTLGEGNNINDQCLWKKNIAGGVTITWEDKWVSDFLLLLEHLNTSETYSSGLITSLLIIIHTLLHALMLSL